MTYTIEEIQYTNRVRQLGAAHGALVTVHVYLRDEDHLPAVAEESATHTHAVSRVRKDGRVQHGGISYGESWLPLPEVTSPLAPSLWFEDGRPSRLLGIHRQDPWDGASVRVDFEFVATSTATPTLFLTGELTEAPLELPTIGVEPRPALVRRPRFGVWDGYPDQVGKGLFLGPGLQGETVGADLTMQAFSGQSKPSRVNAGYRGYNTIRGAEWIEGGIQATTARHFPTPTTVNCLWFHNAVADRYSNEGVTQLANGDFDDDTRAWVKYLPLDVVAYGFPLHEADYYGGKRVGLDPELYRQALVHWLEVAADEALRQGRTPANFGIGGLLTDGPMSRGIGDPWAWYRDLPKWLLDTGFIVGAWDSYRLIQADGSRQPFRARVDAATKAFRAGGVERFFLAETAQGLDYASERDVIGGDVQDTLGFLADVEQWLRDEGEFAFLFSKPEGEMSRHGSLTRPGLELAARKAYYMCQKYNIPVVAQ